MLTALLFYVDLYNTRNNKIVNDLLFAKLRNNVHKQFAKLG